MASCCSDSAIVDVWRAESSYLCVCVGGSFLKMAATYNVMAFCVPRPLCYIETWL